MLDHLFQQRLETLLAAANITINGNSPWDIRVHDRRMFRKTVLQGNLGFGESYMEGWWDCDDLEELFYRILSAGLDRRLVNLAVVLEYLHGAVINLQKPARAFTVGKRHYDAGNDLFRAMLDPLMMYSCACWHEAETLAEAQQNKLRLVFDKLALEPGMSLLDIGCGWGGAARFAAERYGARVVGITVSKEQASFAREFCKSLDVDIRLMDYRQLDGEFDRIVSIGMLEHVGYKNYRTYFDIARCCLKPDGRMLVQSIGSNEPVTSTDPWIEKYIFPNSMLPSPSQISHGFEGRLVLEDWHSFGYDYALTLKAWESNITRKWSQLEEHYDRKFYRMWRYYLLSCAGAFRARTIQLWQILLTPSGIKGECCIPRQPVKRRFRDRENDPGKPHRMPAPVPGQQREFPRSGVVAES
ncbi:cyclopropane fatty acyl phospholipid synthase [Chlorobaculum sp. MV4-Y]|uniref:cyclopropane fatty acyl phospholipid synthase n=1 Tax=Chlorobaculum sp. MV4-Y TaxID=2976335 RepID=UPI0021AEB56D|nr:cyclopropane fatty acyl phospholipid synthase [Chlorobaculum sp. MV4-Y]UWX58441.1 cyclopropane fatty acyl phospholipid synthase [Chlorobaculum sp. MV4-Y]